MTAFPTATTVWSSPRRRAFTLDALVQESLTGSYTPFPLPTTTIRPPAHTALCPEYSTAGALVVEAGLQVSVAGSYRKGRMVQREERLVATRTIISLPVHTALCWVRHSGASSSVGSQVSSTRQVWVIAGSRRDPVDARARLGERRREERAQISLDRRPPLLADLLSDRAGAAARRRFSVRERSTLTV